MSEIEQELIRLGFVWVGNFYRKNDLEIIQLMDDDPITRWFISPKPTYSNISKCKTSFGESITTIEELTNYLQSHTQ